MLYRYSDVVIKLFIYFNQLLVLKGKKSLNIYQIIPKSVIKSHQSNKDRQCHGQKKTDKRQTILENILYRKLPIGKHELY
jgi:hypothetical protein